MLIAYLDYSRAVKNELKLENYDLLVSSLPILRRFGIRSSLALSRLTGIFTSFTF